MKRLALFVLVLTSLKGGPMGLLRIDDIAGAPVLAVARVDRVGSDCTAQLTILRATSRIDDPLLLSYNCGPRANTRGGGISISDYPDLHSGEIDVFPLRRVEDEWRLLHDRGRGLLIPAIERDLDGLVAASGRDFLRREITNLLLHGTYADLYRFGRSSGSLLPGTIAAEIVADLNGFLPAGDARWLDISTALLGSMGIPRPPLDTLMEPPREYLGVLRVLLASTLRNVPAEGRREAIIRAMLRRGTVHDWGTAATLVPEFKDHPLLTELLPGYIDRAQPGALYVAMWLVRNERLAILTAALPASLKALRAEDTIRNDTAAASFLLVGHGNDAQFAEFLRIFRAARAAGRDRYWLMWQYHRTVKGSRFVRMAAIALADDRIHSGGVRYCDLAASRLQTVTGQDFGITALWTQTSAERDRAVLRARAWIARQEQQ